MDNTTPFDESQFVPVGQGTSTPPVDAKPQSTPFDESQFQAVQAPAEQPDQPGLIDKTVDFLGNANPLLNLIPNTRQNQYFNEFVPGLKTGLVNSFAALEKYVVAPPMDALNRLVGLPPNMNAATEYAKQLAAEKQGKDLTPYQQAGADTGESVGFAMNPYFAMLEPATVARTALGAADLAKASSIAGKSVNIATDLGNFSTQMAATAAANGQDPVTAAEIGAGAFGTAKVLSAAASNIPTALRNIKEIFSPALPELDADVYKQKLQNFWNNIKNTALDFVGKQDEITAAKAAPLMQPSQQDLDTYGQKLENYRQGLKQNALNVLNKQDQITLAQGQYQRDLDTYNAKALDQSILQNNYENNVAEQENNYQTVQQLQQQNQNNLANTSSSFLQNVGSRDLDANDALSRVLTNTVDNMKSTTAAAAAPFAGFKSVPAPDAFSGLVKNNQVASQQYSDFLQDPNWSQKMSDQGINRGTLGELHQFSQFLGDRANWYKNPLNPSMVDPSGVMSVRGQVRDMLGQNPDFNQYNAFQRGQKVYQQVLNSDPVLSSLLNPQASQEAKSDAINRMFNFNDPQDIVSSSVARYFIKNNAPQIYDSLVRNSMQKVIDSTGVGSSAIDTAASFFKNDNRFNALKILYRDDPDRLSQLNNIRTLVLGAQTLEQAGKNYLTNNGLIASVPKPALERLTPPTAPNTVLNMPTSSYKIPIAPQAPQPRAVPIPQEPNTAQFSNIPIAPEAPTPPAGAKLNVSSILSSVKDGTKGIFGIATNPIYAKQIALTNQIKDPDTKMKLFGAMMRSYYLHNQPQSNSQQPPQQGQQQ
jgi:hypothetical protein